MLKFGTVCVVHLKLPLYKVLCASIFPIFLFIIQKVNQVYPLIGALFSQYIKRLKLFQWVFDINVNSVYTICIKDCVQIDICINCIAYYSCEYVRTGTKLIRLISVLTGWFI